MGASLHIDLQPSETHKEPFGIAGPLSSFYNPLTGRYSLGRDCDVNYLLHTVKNV